MYKKNKIMLLSVIAFACAASPGYAATPIDLEHSSAAILNMFGNNLTKNGDQLKEIHRSLDVNRKTHVRFKQYYLNTPVWGGDAVVHMSSNASLSSLTNDKNIKMNGRIYQDLPKDLPSLPVDKSQDVLSYLVKQYKKEHAHVTSTQQEKTHLIVYIDQANKAHWAYFVSFMIDHDALPAKPTYIIDAETLHIYQQWNDLRTGNAAALGGGYGGNKKTGKLTYDGLKNNFPILNIERNASTSTCYLKNKDVMVVSQKNKNAVIQYSCKLVDKKHNKVYWDGDLDAVNGAYSPGNDALYIGRVIQDMYLKWYNTPALVDDQGNPMLLKMRVHANMDNAYWDGKSMTFGDGISMFYPLVSLGVGSHEVSHGFTEQHSNLVYYGESGGLNESFSDMAAQAAEFYSLGKNSWQIGPEILIGDGALRYMDTPSKDCEGLEPGEDCSIDKTSQYQPDLDVHYSSGIFNRAFYLIATADGWNTKKAFDVMVAANQHYWLPTTTWSKAACGVLSAAQDLGYDAEAIKNAFTKVEVDYSSC